MSSVVRLVMKVVDMLLFNNYHFRVRLVMVVMVILHYDNGVMYFIVRMVMMRMVMRMLVVVMVMGIGMVIVMMHMVRLFVVVMVVVMRIWVVMVMFVVMVGMVITGISLLVMTGRIRPFHHERFAFSLLLDGGRRNRPLWTFGRGTRSDRVARRLFGGTLLLRPLDFPYFFHVRLSLEARTGFLWFAREPGQVRHRLVVRGRHWLYFRRRLHLVRVRVDGTTGLDVLDIVTLAVGSDGDVIVDVLADGLDLVAGDASDQEDEDGEQVDSEEQGRPGRHSSCFR